MKNDLFLLHSGEDDQADLLQQHLLLILINLHPMQIDPTQIQPRQIALAQIAALQLEAGPLNLAKFGAAKD